MIVHAFVASTLNKFMREKKIPTHFEQFFDKKNGCTNNAAAY